MKGLTMDAVRLFFPPDTRSFAQADKLTVRSVVLQMSDAVDNTEVMLYGVYGVSLACALLSSFAHTMCEQG